jgi:precorrin-3B synthase
VGEFEIKGWCPSALRPMMSGDGLVVRIRPPMARLTQVQVKGIAQAADQYGNGLIDLSARGNLQVRGVRDGAHQALLSDLVDLGLVETGAGETGTGETGASETNITVTPFWHSGDGTLELVDEVVKALAQGPALPAKFGIAIDIGANAVLTGVSADIRILRGPDGGLVLHPDGSGLGRVVAVTEVARAMAELVGWFVGTGGIRQGRGRMAAHLAGGVPLPQGYTRAVPTAGFQAKPGAHPLGFMVGVAFGQLTADTLSGLGRQPLRITPWRMVLLEDAQRAPDLPDLVTVADDPRLRVTACTGATACSQGLQATRPLARRLAGSVPPGRHLHVSGCAKGCAHPGAADVTLCGTREGFSVIRGGRASDPADGRFDSAASLFKGLS